MASRDEAHAFFDTSGALVTAPAGCGKTELIADAVGIAQARQRQLILTHTNAGVAAIRRRLALKNTAPDRFRVTTIASFSLGWAGAYRGMSGLEPDAEESGDWDAVYEAAGRLLESELPREVLATSYAGVFVDEYQDCNVAQHDLLVKLGEVLPLRVVGDPMQAIFDFAASPSVDWDGRVLATYTPVFELMEPHRWSERNPELGAWTLEARRQLASSGELDLRTAPLRGRFADNQHRGILRHLYGYNAEDEVVYIAKPRARAQAFAKRAAGGRFGAIDELAGGDLLRWVATFEDCTGYARVEAVLRFAEATCVGVTAGLGPALVRTVRELRPPSAVIAKRLPGVLALVKEVAGKPGFRPVADLLLEIQRLEDVRVYRTDLFWDMYRTCAVHDLTSGRSLAETATHVRDKSRVAGRRLGRRTASDVLLIKGLEFEHAIASLTGMTVKETYVAVTRAAESLTITMS